MAKGRNEVRSADTPAKERRPRCLRVRTARSGVLAEMARRLDRHYGPQDWWPAQTPFEVAVGAILTQNTNWRNVERAIEALRAAGALDVRKLAFMEPSELASLIRPAGYFNVKARRLAAFCKWLLEKVGGAISALASVETDALRAELLGVHGIGPETADSILLYALGRPVFVIDAYTRRVLERHGLAAGREPYEYLRAFFEVELAHPSHTAVCRFNELHARIVALAKNHCRTRPACEGCPLSGWSPVRSNIDERN